MNNRKISHYMRMAKFVGEDDNKCLSRSIGVVAVDPSNNHVLATGYNGPPRKNPRCDDPEYLEQVVWPQLSDEEKRNALGTYHKDIDPSERGMFCKQYGNRCMCPRRVVGAPSGQRLELCSCAHAEKNAITNATADLEGAYLFCFCGVPCFDCSKYVVNAGIDTCFTLKSGGDYSHGSRYMLRKGRVKLVELEDDEIFNQ